MGANRSPFVGCSSFGQIRELEAPKGVSQLVAIPERDGQALAYYKSADGISVLAPRGWQCQGVSGSSGAVLLVGPKPIHLLSSGRWEGLDGAAISVRRTNGQNSGRYEIASLVARVFPAYRAFAHRVWQGFDEPLPASPYPKDTLTYLSDTVVEYRTPAGMEGLGSSEVLLGRSALPVSGTVVLSVDPAHADRVSEMLTLSVRLAPEFVRLAPLIAHYVQNEAGRGKRD